MLCGKVNSHKKTDVTQPCRWKDSSPNCISQFLRYGLVGFANTALHGIVFALLVSSGIEQSYSNFCAFLVAVIFSFFVNARFTFKKQPTLSKFLKMSSMMAILSYFGGWFGDLFGLHYLVTFIFWSLFSFIAGFIFSKLVVFNK